jgi:hypothetical protein
MADRMSQAGQSIWYWYELDPADLAVEAGTPEAKGLSLVWKGRVDVTQLGQFFASAVNTISPVHSARCRASFVTPEGPKNSDVNLEDVASVLPKLIAEASYIRLEWPLPPEGKPALTVWSNRDDKASSLDELQQCVGIRVMPDHLPALEDGISSLVASMSVRPFRNSMYQREAVLARLRQLRDDLPEMSIEGARS